MLRKWMASLLAVVLATGLFAVPAFAQETPARQAPASFTPVTQEFLDSLKAKLEVLITLRVEAIKLESQLKAQAATNKELYERYSKAAGGDLSVRLKELQTRYKTEVEAKLATLKEKSKALEAQYYTAKESGDEIQQLLLRVQLQSVRLEMSQVAAPFQPLRDEIAQLEAEIKAKREAAKAVAAKVQLLYEQEKPLSKKLEERKSALKGAWKGIDSALERWDLPGMLGAMDAVIAAQTEVNAQLTQTLALRTEAAKLLQDAIGQ